MYRIRPGCAAEARLNTPADQTRRMRYRGKTGVMSSPIFMLTITIKKGIDCTLFKSIICDLY